VSVSAAAIPRKTTSRVLHKTLVALFACALFGAFFFAFFRGLSYYFLPLGDRPYHALNHELRPSGRVGIGYGIFATVIFGALYVYPLRKRWTWLRSIGTTRHWLDFHIVMGLAAPLLVAIHSSFKFRGLAGLAYLVMLAVVMSGIVGRYLYAQVPRSRRDAELSLDQMNEMSTQLSDDLSSQALVREQVWRPLLVSVRREEALRMPLVKALLWMLMLDLARPFRMARLRREALTPWERILTLGGLLASSHPDLERVVGLVRRQSWLTAKICFLDRAGQIFKVWHVVHLPFSYSFLLLAIIHIGMATWMGFL